MANTEWMIKGPSFVNCNCAYGCPCQFTAMPTDGTCRAIAGMRIDEGNFGDTKLDGLNWAGTLNWPGAIHEGNGTCQFFIDERADEAQRHGISEILHGRHTDEMATHFAVFATTMTTVHDPQFVHIDFEADPDACTAKINVPGVIESVGGPIISTFSGEPHRITVSMRSGFEYTSAECGSGTSKSMGEVKMEFTDSYGQFIHTHMNGHGPIR